MSDRRKRKKEGGPTPPSGDYEVGYGRPPLHTRFQKGQPRPPRKPRPDKAARTFDDYLASELQELMPIKENGVEQTVPKGQALAKASINGAIKNGDPRRLKGFLPKPKTEADLDFSETDIAMVARFLANRFPGGLEGLARLIGNVEGDNQPSGRDAAESPDDEEDGQ